MANQKHLKGYTAIIEHLSTHYRAYGNGQDTILLLHGWGQSSAFWKDLITKLSDTYTVYILDLPGFGLSQEPPFVWSLDDYARFIHSFTSQFNVKNPIIIGHSFGGSIASVYASRYPLQKLILYSSGGIPASVSLYSKLYRKVIVNIGKHIAPNMVYKSHTLLFKPKNYTNKVVITRKRSKRMLDIYTSLSGNLEKNLKHIHIPTLIIVGNNDFIVQPITGRYINSLIPTSHLVQIPHATHFAHIEQPEAFYNIILIFLRNTQDRH